MNDKVIADLNKSYGVNPLKISPVEGGYLNLKWRVLTEKGELLVKQYSHKRFSPEKLEKIEMALQRQVKLYGNGVNCPYLWQSDGQIIRRLDNETVYMVMEFRQGNVENAETISLRQMESLGETCAIMHREFSKLPQPEVETLPDFGGYTLDALWGNFNLRKAELWQSEPIEYEKAVVALEPILEQLEGNFFEKFPIGFTHEDFHAGNIIFSESGVSAILDFDRNCYSYIWHDIGRAILSFALEGNKLNMEKVNFFLKGYLKYLPLTLKDIADALRLVWCIETVWWVRPEIFKECGETAERFKFEILWLTKNWFEINSILGV